MHIPAFMSFWYDIIPLSVATALVIAVIIYDLMRDKR